MFYILHIFHVPEYKFCTTMYIRKMSRFHDFPHVPGAAFACKNKNQKSLPVPGNQLVQSDLHLAQQKHHGECFKVLELEEESSY